MIDFQLKSHTIKGKNITMRVYEKGFTLFINHPYGYSTSIIVDGGLYKEIVNELNREVVAELREEMKELFDGCIAIKTELIFEVLDKKFGCEKPMKDKTDIEISRSYVSTSVVGSQKPKKREDCPALLSGMCRAICHSFEDSGHPLCVTVTNCPKGYADNKVNTQEVTHEGGKT